MGRAGAEHQAFVQTSSWMMQMMESIETVLNGKQESMAAAEGMYY